MTILLTLTTAGANASFFDFYSDVDGFTNPFETGISKLDLQNGYTTSLCPDNTTIVRVKATGTCVNYVDVPLDNLNCNFTGVTECITTTTTSTTPLPVTGLNWDLTVSNSCDSEPWAISNQNLKIRYNITDSVNCGGPCSTTQAGTATATITVGGKDVNMGLSFEGVGELQASNYEKITFTLDGQQIARANAAGGNLGCQMGPVVQSYNVPPPYYMEAFSEHTLFIDFTTADNLYHIDAFYEINLTFTELD